MRGHEPGGKNHSTDGSGVGGAVSSRELNGELPRDADGDGCLGQVQDRPADFVAAELFRFAMQQLD